MEVSEAAELGAIAPEWDALVDSMPLPSPFLRSWWLSHVAVGEPVFLLVRDGGSIVGGAAFQRTTRHGCEWLEMLGDGQLSPDHLDLVAAPGSVTAVQAAVRNWLGRPGSRVLDFVGLVEQSWLGAATPGFGTNRVHAVAPYVVLPATFAEYLGTRHGKLRSTVTRTGKRLTAAGVTTRVRPSSEVDAGLEDLRRLHDERWGERSGFLAGWQGFADAVRGAALVGEATFTELVTADGAAIATELEFLVGGRASFYQAGRLGDHEYRGSGSVLKAAVIEAAIDAGVREFDLLRGDEPYKTEWAVSRRRLYRVRHGVGPRGLALVAAAEANLWREGRRIRAAITTPDDGSTA